MVVKRRHVGDSSEHPAPKGANFGTEERPSYGYRCMAFGCPLRGTWNQNPYAKGDDGWQCFVHSELPPEMWQRATQLVRENAAIFTTPGQNINGLRGERQQMRAILKQHGIA